jgi:3-methyladenine DNA glycosylase Tag
MQKFDEIYQQACDRKGGEAALKRLMPKVRGARALANTGDDRYLSEMTRCVFQAGFVWRVVNQKWDDFEDVFFGFPPNKIVMLSPDQIDRISQNPRIIRNRQKVLSVQHNATFLLDVAKEYGSFGKLIGGWPTTDLIGLLAYLKKSGSRLGGMTGQRVLRNMGRDTFVITGDVSRALQRAGLDISASPVSKRQLTLVQAAFNTWHEQTGLPYSHLSRICACSLD